MALLNSRRGGGGRGGQASGNGMLSLATSLRGLFIMAILMLGAIQLIGRDTLSSSSSPQPPPPPSAAVASEAAVEMEPALRGAGSSTAVAVEETVDASTGDSEEEKTVLADDAAADPDPAADADAAVSCVQGSSLSKPIVLDFAAIQAFDPKDRFEEIKGFTAVDYEQYLLGPAGSEHYILLHYLATHYADDPTSSCPEQRRHMVDIGTRYVTSALALASAVPTHPIVWTFDTPESMERTGAFRDGKSEEDWQNDVKAHEMDITFYNLDLLSVSDEEFTKYMNTWFIMLDTENEPDTHPFEREWLQRLIGAQFFNGIILMDDIHVNDEMEKWWNELKENAERDGYVVYDLTKVGHATGTGMLDFSGGQVTVIDNIE